MDSRTWVVHLGDWTYVWPHGNRVDIYGAGEYVRRLSGELREAQPAFSVAVNGFAGYEVFREWCREDRRKRDAAAAPPIPPRPLGTVLTGDLRAT